MKIFTNKKRTQKIIVGLIILLLFNFIVPNYSKANDMIDWVVRPISFLFTTLFDGANYLLQLAMIGGSPDVVIPETRLQKSGRKHMNQMKKIGTNLQQLYLIKKIYLKVMNTQYQILNIHQHKYFQEKLQH